jgi:hypothetical protein
MLSLPVSIEMLKYRADVLPDAPTRRRGGIRLTSPYVYVSRIMRNSYSVPEGSMTPPKSSKAGIAHLWGKH